VHKFIAKNFKTNVNLMCDGRAHKRTNEKYIFLQILIYVHCATIGVPYETLVVHYATIFVHYATPLRCVGDVFTCYPELLLYPVSQTRAFYDYCQRPYIRCNNFYVFSRFEVNI